MTPTSAREAILAAARRRFGEQGYRSATIRQIAADARVDPALVMHYFGNKADLFAAAVSMPIKPSDELAAIVDGVSRDEIGVAIVRLLLRVWENPDFMAAWQGLIRSAASDEAAAEMLREFLVSVVFARLASALDYADAETELRLSLVASQIVGLGIARHIIKLEPLASASSDQVVAAIAPTLQRYLTGDL